MTLGRGTLRSKLASFVKKQEVNKHVERYKLFYSDVDTCQSEDITKTDPDPCLHGKHVMPMTVPAMSEVAQALLNLSAKVSEVLHLPKHSSSKGFGKRFVAMLPSSEKKHLYQNAKGWMRAIAKASAIDDNDSNTTTDESMKTHDVVEVLIKVLLTIDPIAFEDVAAAMSDTKSHRSKYKLDPELQQAMMFASGIKQSQMRVLKKHLCYANLDMLQPETKMKKLQVNQCAKPTSIPFKDGGNRTKVAWAVPVDTVLMFEVNQSLAANAINFDNLSHAHVILVGDHGQGAFRMMATLLLIQRPNRRCPGAFVNEFMGTVKSVEVDALVGCAQCQKDTCTVLEETIAVPIDEALQRIKDSTKVTTCADAPGGKPKMCWGNTHTHNTVLATSPVVLFMTGDLAFYSMVLGKEHMAPYWCWRCKSTKQQWTDVDPDVDGCPVGDNWSLAACKDHLEQLENGDLNPKKPEQRLGVTKQALFCIEILNILVPPLHNNELFVNTPLKALMSWINHCIEDLPLEIIDARLERIDLTM